MSGSIDVEYKHIGNTVGELIANPFSTTTQTRNVDKEGSEMKTLEFMTQVCFVGEQTFQNLSERATAMVMTARPVMYYDGDLQLLASSSSCLQVAINYKNSTPQSP